MKKIFLTVGAVLLPVAVFAQGVSYGPGYPGYVQPTGASADSILSRVQGILNVVIPILITLAVIYFIVGVIKYISAKDEAKQKEARGIMVSGIIGLFVIIAIWGLVNVITNTFGVGANQAPDAPCIPNPSAKPPITCN